MTTITDLSVVLGTTHLEDLAVWAGARDGHLLISGPTAWASTTALVQIVTQLSSQGAHVHALDVEAPSLHHLTNLPGVRVISQPYAIDAELQQLFDTMTGPGFNAPTVLAVSGSRLMHNRVFCDLLRCARAAGLAVVMTTSAGDVTSLPGLGADVFSSHLALGPLQPSTAQALFADPSLAHITRRGQAIYKIGRAHV